MNISGGSSKKRFRVSFISSTQDKNPPIIIIVSKMSRNFVVFTHPEICDFLSLGTNDVVVSVAGGLGGVGANVLAVFQVV